MKLFQILFVMMLFGMAFSAPTICYQETANVSTVCGGLATGAYGGNWIGSTYLNDSAMAYDGNWATPTYNFSDDVQNYLVINYTIPAGTLNAIWQVKWISGNNESETRNFTISPYCDNTTGKYDLMLNVYPNQTAGYMSFACRMPAGNWNSTGMIDYGNPSNITNISIFEEAIWWNISNVVVPTFDSPTNTTYTTPDVNLNFTCVGDAASWLYNISIAGTPLRINNATANDTYNLIGMAFSDGGWYANLTCANDTLTLSNTTTVYFTVRSANTPTLATPTNTSYTSTGQNNRSFNISCIGALDAYLANLTIVNLSSPTNTHTVYTDYPVLNDSYYLTYHFLQDGAYMAVMNCTNDTYGSYNTTNVTFTIDVNATRFYTETMYWTVNRTTGNGTVSTPLLDSIYSDSGTALTTITALVPLLVLAIVGGTAIFYLTSRFGRETA